MHRGGEGRRGALSAGPAGSAAAAVWAAGRAREAEVRCAQPGPPALSACVCDGTAAAIPLRVQTCLWSPGNV